MILYKKIAIPVLKQGQRGKEDAWKLLCARFSLLARFRSGERARDIAACKDASDDTLTKLGLTALARRDDKPARFELTAGADLQGVFKFSLLKDSEELQEKL